MFVKMKIYLDNAATTRVADEVIKAMLPYFRLYYGNPSSLHTKGHEAKEALEKSRKILAKSINAKQEEIIFTSGGSESNNLAIKGIAYALQHKGDEIFVSSIEHPSVLEAARSLVKKGFVVKELPVDSEGLIKIDELERLISSRTILVSVMHANNEIGTIQPIKEIAKICKEKDIIFHTDAVQSFTKVGIDVKKIKADLISFSAHKIHGPKGVGALFIRQGTKIERQIDGGSQEKKLRAGTENVPGIVGFAKAVQLAKKSYIKKMEKLRDMLIDSVLASIENCRLNGSRKERLCNNANFSFIGVEGEAIGTYLNSYGIYTSTGSACSQLTLKPSHVLKAIGLKPEEWQGSLRMTLSRYTTKEEISYVLEILPKVVKRLRRISSFKF